MTPSRPAPPGWRRRLIEVRAAAVAHLPPTSLSATESLGLVVAVTDGRSHALLPEGQGMTEHDQRCRGRGAEYADSITARIKAGKVHPSGYEGLILSHLDQATYRDHHSALHDLSLTRFDGRSRNSR